MRNSWYLILVTLAVLTTSCDRRTQTESERQPASTLSVQTETETQTAAPNATTSESAPISTNQPNTFESGLDKAAGAFSISQSAQSSTDWNLVAGQYQDAVALMKQVQRDSPYYSIAQNKIGEYQQLVKQALLKSVSPITTTPQPQPQPTQVVVVVPETITTQTPTPKPQKPLKIIAPVATQKPLQKPSPQLEPAQSVEQTVINQQINQPINEQISEEVITVPIKRRMGGTPVIEVKFNDAQFFEMIVDTGASGTVITQKMAQALQVVPVGKAKANTASSKAVTFPIGYINSMEAGLVKVNQVPVAIAGAELETGLLGHDFFGNYDITIKRDVVQFQRHAPTTSAETQSSIPIYPKLRR
jgi:predicted aspartyl protease